LVVEVPAADLTLVGEEQVTAQRVQTLAFVQLSPHPAAELVRGDVAAGIDRADEPAVLVHGLG
jgi:hypothetical protein